MKNRIDHISDIKELLFKSPVRKCMENQYNIPFKDLVLENLNDVLDNIEILEGKIDNPLKIVIVGEVKSGKSSFINAFLSKEVSEVDVLEATSDIIEITYDKEEYDEIYEDIRRIGVDLEELKKINIVDTPGLKSITVKNEQKTLKYIQNADLILFLFDATHLGQDDIEEVLDLIVSYKKPLVGIINKCDLLESNKLEIEEYIKNEYGIYMDDFFMISSYLEYQDRISKNAEVGSTDLVISNYSELKENFLNLSKYIENVYYSCDETKLSSMSLSLEAIIHKEIINHHDYKKSISVLNDELIRYEKLLDNKFNYINSKINFEIENWVNEIFLVDELNNIKDNIENASVYINEKYINGIINKKKSELDNLFFEEWTECLKEINNEINEDINKHINNINYKKKLLDAPVFKFDDDKVDLNEMLATVGTGAILGATSGSIASIYAASIGSSSATLTIGSAMMSYCPPLLLAGTITGALAKLVYHKVKSNQKNKDILDDIDNFIQELQINIISELKEGYYNSSKDIVDTTQSIFKSSKSIFMNKYELQKLIDELELYIKQLKKYINN
ncbi:GTP-binding protein [Romboutsia maritimum]|uniref:GTP-binding protein n=1 Tax=Romboutsia maritimum TaxID=2020948 RepID=A0A371ITP2_9FIRM|nr:dynamin family protein [Romboutsia maritimum]RDY23854.1 GTP-binding protein [Romboutsia maritimum]